MIKYSDYSLPRRKQRKAFVKGFFIGAIACGLSLSIQVSAGDKLAPETTGLAIVCDKYKVIHAHYAEVIENIGKVPYFVPGIDTPPRKPDR